MFSFVTSHLASPVCMIIVVFSDLNTAHWFKGVFILPVVFLADRIPTVAQCWLQQFYSHHRLQFINKLINKTKMQDVKYSDFHIVGEISQKGSLSI